MRRSKGQSAGSADGSGRAGRVEARQRHLASISGKPSEVFRYALELSAEVEAKTEEVEHARARVRELTELQRELEKEFEVFTSPELHPGVVVGRFQPEPRRVRVSCGDARLEVSVHPDIPAEKLKIGAQVLLSKSRNCVLELPDEEGHWTEVGTFESRLEGGRRMLLRCQDQLVAATVADGLAREKLERGDLVGFERGGAPVAYEKVEPPGKEHLFFDEKPTDQFSELGGLDVEIERLKSIVDLSFFAREVGEAYLLPRRVGILLEGPPGNGKTKLARCLFSYLRQRCPQDNCWFMVIQGSADYSMWLGETERRFRERFEAATERSRQGPGILFMDELDAFCTTRGMDSGSRAPDRILATFLSLLDGIRTRTDNVLLIGASNRADVLDPGVTRPGRMGDERILIGAPNRRGARAILRYYLGRGMPLEAPPGPSDAVDRLVEPLLARLFSPRGEYAEVATLQLQSGSTQAVSGRELLSGALLENVVRTASFDAARRQQATGQVGVSEEDLAAALERAVQAEVQQLRPSNVHDRLAGLSRRQRVIDVVPRLRGRDGVRYARSA